MKEKQCRVHLPIVKEIINDKIKKKSSFSLKGGNKLLKGKEYKIRTKIKTVIYA